MCFPSLAQALTALTATCPSWSPCVRFDPVQAIPCAAIKEEHPKCRSDLSLSSLEILWWFPTDYKITSVFLSVASLALQKRAVPPAWPSLSPPCAQMTLRPGHGGLFQLALTHAPLFHVSVPLYLCSHCSAVPFLGCVSGELLLIPVAPNPSSLSSPVPMY